MIYSNINNFLKAVSTKNRWAEGMFGIRQPVFFLTFLFSLSISAQFEPPTNAYLKDLFSRRYLAGRLFRRYV